MPVPCQNNLFYALSRCVALCACVVCCVALCTYCVTVTTYFIKTMNYIFLYKTHCLLVANK